MNTIATMNQKELRAECKTRGITGYGNWTVSQLRNAIIEWEAANAPKVEDQVAKEPGKRELYDQQIVKLGERVYSPDEAENRTYNRHEMWRAVTAYLSAKGGKATVAELKEIARIANDGKSCSFVRKHIRRGHLVVVK